TSDVPLDYEPGIPDDFKLYENYPNPFNPVTNIEFDVLNSAFVDLKVYDIRGGEVEILVNKQLPAGHYKVTFNSEELASGIYLYKIRMDDFYAVKKMTLIK
ncbi:MAG: T9SS type A sorting domain-containing protein, partial [Ignavibacteria bacterium]|nr:T9SS type A sorting domain-containing protein [Ignavibacteria bacterium]